MINCNTIPTDFELNHGKRDNSINLFSFSQSAGSADGHRFLGLSLLIGWNITSNLVPLEGQALPFSLLWQLFYKDVRGIKYQNHSTNYINLSRKNRCTSIYWSV